MHAVIVAGGAPVPDDPLYPETQGKQKALIDVCGQPMVRHVEQACYGCEAVSDVTVVGFEPQDAALFESTTALLPDHGGLVPNTYAGVTHALAASGPGLVLLMSGDIPLLQSAHIDAFLDGCKPDDRLVYYRFVRQEVVEKRFPNAQRTYTRLRDATVTQADLFLVHTDVLGGDPTLWYAMANARKQPWRIARLVGLRILLKLLLRRLTLDELSQTGERLVGGPVNVGFLPFAEPAMDVDKPQHLAAVRAACADSAEF